MHQWKVDADGKPRNPDRLVIDLDPGEPAGLHECCAGRAAGARRAGRARPDLHAGHQRQQGAPPVRRAARRRRRSLDSDGTTALAKEVAEGLQAEHAALVTATMTKAKRPGKVFLDWSQNSGSKTTISPYSLRGRERPTVATPLTWDEVEAGAEDELALEQFRWSRCWSGWPSSGTSSTREWTALLDPGR